MEPFGRRPRPTQMCDICGVHTTRDLKGLGYSDSDIRKADLTHERRGWYSTSAADPAVLSAVRAGGVLSCVSALKFVQNHGIPALWVPPGDTVHVRLSKGGKSRVRSRCRVKLCQGAGRPLPTAHAVDEIPVALSCAARCVAEDCWIAMCDSVLHNTPLTIPDLQAAMGTVSQTVRTMMSRCDSRSETGTESIVRVRLRAAGYRVHVQPRIGRSQRSDLRIGRLIIECDSEAYHGGEARRGDLRRDRKTVGRGWVTMRVDYFDVMHRWDDVLADIADFTSSERHRIRRPQDFPGLID
ncbi:hypothetical protein GOEFS_040_00130 [Gordonia effusa NBRC 100432]|uniref:DUF559 domain-containing protein n=1 Tax=Gordonia effusa NBRC 100432 TaxID=1077974 RepID=H0QYE2_9ACTN|nr:hypothetical protein [Gordonia effusa]GAB17843.1 hypothetical protein GOEFS_040_00130 [Gordonia effusa NBRC 100432]